MFLRLINLFLKAVYRPSVEKIAKDLKKIENDLVEYVMTYDISKEQVDEAFKAISNALPMTLGDDVVLDIFDDIKYEYINKQIQYGTVIRAQLLSPKDYNRYLLDLVAVRDKIFTQLIPVIRIKLINEMARTDFERTMGMSKEKWDQEKARHKDYKDELKDTVESIQNKEELPSEIKDALKELNGFLIPELNNLVDN